MNIEKKLVFKFTALANKILSKKSSSFFIEKNRTELIDKIKDQVPSTSSPELNSKLSCPALVTALASRLRYSID